jgi:hypothetical protein
MYSFILWLTYVLETNDQPWGGTKHLVVRGMGPCRQEIADFFGIAKPDLGDSVIDAAYSIRGLRYTSRAMQKCEDLVAWNG